MSTDVFRRYIDIVTESAAHAVTEMDKSQPSHGRDGHVSHSTYGSRDKEGSDYFKGKELPAKPITLKKMEKDALDILKKQGVAEGTKALADYIAESERAYSQPVPGDYFAINIREETLFETWVCDETADGIVIYADDTGMALLEQYGYLGDAVMEMHHIDDYEADSDGSDVDVVDQGEYDFEGDQAKDQLRTIVRAARRLNGMLDDDDNLPEWVQMKITKAEDYIDTAADYMESNREQGVAEGFGTNPTQPGTWHGHKIVANRKTPKGSFLILQNKNDNRYEIHRQTPNAVGGLEFVSVHKTPEEMQTAFRQLTGVDESNQEMSEGDMAEAKYQGREVPLGKPMAGDVKKSKVYVRGPKGNVVKVNFGQKGMKIKKNIPGRRKNFRARHNCANPGPRWKARYWSCRAW